MPLDAGDFSLMDRKVVSALLTLPETDQFLRGLRAWVGFKQTGVDYVRPRRPLGVRPTAGSAASLGWARESLVQLRVEFYYVSDNTSGTQFLKK